MEFVQLLQVSLVDSFEKQGFGLGGSSPLFRVAVWIECPTWREFVEKRK